MAAHSDHPVSQAIALGLEGYQCDGDLDNFTSLAGRDIQAQTHGTSLVLINQRLIEESSICSTNIQETPADADQ